MTNSEIQEALVTLFLRLNGYFTSGFIVHSADHGAARTEIDVLAMRLPNNAEPIRDVDGAPELHRWNHGIDLIIGEVKSHGQPLQFNEGLRQSHQSVKSVLQWWGHLTQNEVDELVDPVLRILAPRPGALDAPTVLCPRDARVRAILFSPETNTRRPEQAWFISGPPMLSYIWRCLRPEKLRPECATVYDFGLWGHGLEPLVLYFKDPARQEPGQFRTLVEHLA
jgi:hypothetical protein